MNTTCNVTHTLTTWNCTCGKYGVILGEGIPTYECKSSK